MKQKSAKGMHKQQPQPPVLNSGTSHTATRRFSSLTATVAVPVYCTDIFRAFGQMAANATQLYCPWNQLKVHSIKIWAPPPSDAGVVASPISITPAANGTGVALSSDGTNLIDAGISKDQGAFMNYRPKKGSWQADIFAPSNTQVFCYISCPIGSIIDVTATVHNSVTAVTVGVLTTAGATAGYWYYGALDWLNLGAGASTMRPILGAGLSGVV